ncbi:MAG: thioesterase family protein [Chlamydiota bacterium]|nr:thioesterase family protein [Chlamydiota bacterium]
MARLKLELPEQFLFSTDILVHITDINYGGHLGNDRLLSLIHEARLRFLSHYGFSEIDCGGVGIIMGDVAIVFKAQVFYGMTLKIFVCADEFQPFGCDLYYKILDIGTGKEVARAKTGIIFYDYQKKKLAKMPEQFIEKLRKTDR